MLCGPGARPEAVAQGACGGVDVARGVATTARDGTAGPSWLRGADGSFQGAWPREGAAPTDTTPPADDWLPTLPDEAPSATWTPEAGIPGCTTGWPCEPTLRGDCPAGSAALPSGACVAVGDDACPTTGDPWPQPRGPPRPRRTGGARARRRRPRRRRWERGASLSDDRRRARGRHGSDARALLADGEHETPPRIEGDVSLRGRCAARAILGGPPSVAPFAMGGASSHIELVGVTVRDRGVRIAGATATLRRVVIARATGISLRATLSASVELRDVYLNGTVLGHQRRPRRPVGRRRRDGGTASALPSARRTASGCWPRRA